MIVRVISVRGKNPIGLKCVYLGRKMPLFAGHPLGNPFKVSKNATPQEIDECLRNYELWLDAHPRRDELLQELADKVRETNWPLACWCGFWPENPSLKCHVVIVAKRVQAILESNP